MQIETFKYENVLSDGTFLEETGAVETKGKIIMSQKNGGCNLKGCKCSEGHWITIVQPRTEDGIVEGIKMKFDNSKEMQDYLIKMN